jgi:glycine oxidase
LQSCHKTLARENVKRNPGRRVSGQLIEAGLVVVAAGTWRSQLLEPLDLNVKVIPARGQMLAVRSQACLINWVLHSSRVYVVPRNDGRILIGATVEYAGLSQGGDS